MRIIKEIPSIYLSSKFIEPGTKLGIFVSELKSRINNEKEFISFISSIKFWDFNKVSLWSFEEILNYIDEILQKYSITNDDEINRTILIPLLKFIHLLIQNCFSKEIFSSFDHLEKIYLTNFDIKVKTLIIEINLIFIDNKRNLVHVNKIFYKTFSVLCNLKPILMDLINNNFKLNSNLINILEELITNIYNKWSNNFKKRKQRLNQEEQKTISEISPFNLFKEIINNKKNYKNSDNFRSKYKKEYTYFTQGYLNKQTLYEKLMNKENVMKYLIKEEIVYIICINDFLFILNEIVECGLNDKNKTNKLYNNKISLVAKFILLGINLFMKDNQNGYDEETVVSENYIENYYNDVLKIITNPQNSLELKSIFLNAGIYFMTTFDGYDNILFQNGLFHSFLNDLTHQNGNEREALSEKESTNQEFLNIILNFVFNFKIFKEIPINFLSKILEVPKNNVYPYRIDNVIFALKKRKVFDENTVKNIVIPRLIYELENIGINSNELKYNFINDNNTHNITTYERNVLIDRLFKILLKIVVKSSNLISYGNFDQNLTEVFKNIIKDKNIISNIEYTPCIINCIYFFIKICNSFPSKIPWYITNNIFDVIFDYFLNYFPKYDGALDVVYLMFYTICIHNEGKTYVKNNLEKVRNLFGTIFEKIENDNNYFYYNLYVLKDLSKNELYSPYNALVHTDGIAEAIQIIFENVKTYMQKLMNEEKNIKIQRNNKIVLDQKLYFYNSKRAFLNEYFISITEKDIKLFEENLSIEIIPILKTYLDLLLTNTSLYCLYTHYSIITSIALLAKKEPIYVMDKLYNKLNEIITLEQNNELDLEDIQICKISSMVQKMYEFIFSKIYQKSKELINVDKYTLLYTKIFLKNITSRINISFYISTVNDKELLINSNNYIKFLSKKISPEFRNLLTRLSYKFFSKDLPHTTNPELKIIDEDNYKDIKVPIEFNDLNLFWNNYNNFKVEYLSGSFFNSELLTTENKIYNYLISSLDYLTSMGKMIKPKGLYDIKEIDIEMIKNYLKMSYLLKEVIRIFETIYEIKNFDNIDNNINMLLTQISFFNCLNILINGKVSSLVIFYFIKYGGFKEILNVAKKFLFFCKNEFNKNKKEIPVVELLIIKNFWNLQVSLLLFLIKYSFFAHNGFYTLLIRENELSKNFKSMTELDLYIKYLMLNDFIDVFFIKDDFDYNINMINDIEIFSSELMRCMFILFDSSCREYFSSNFYETNLKDIYDKGYPICEIVQVIQEGKKKNDEIIKQIEDYRKKEKEKENEEKKVNNNNNEDNKMNIENEKEKDDEKKLNSEKNKDKENNINNYDINDNNENDKQEKEKEEINTNKEKDKDKDNQNEEKNINNINNNDNNINNNININNNNSNNNNNNNQDNINSINNQIIRFFQGFDDLGPERNDILNVFYEKRSLNKYLKDIEKIPSMPEISFIKSIPEIFPNKNISLNPDLNTINNNTDYNRENFLKKLNYIYDILNKCNISYKKINNMRKMNIKYRIKSFGGDSLPYMEYLKSLIESMKQNREKLNVNNSSEEEILKTELDYKMFINYSIFKFKANRIYSDMVEEIKSITNLNLIEDSIECIKKLITKKKNKDNIELIKKLIYENILNIYIQFCFLEFNKSNYEEKKINFLDTFLLLLKEANNAEQNDLNNLSYINEAIIIFCLQIIVQFFNNNDKSQEMLNQYLINNNLLKYLLDLKFNSNDASANFYDNQFKYFVTLEESFKQFIIKIFSEKNIFAHLLESVLKYAFANINPKNNEVDLEGFIDLCKDYIKIDNKDIFVNTIKKLFFIVQKEKNENKEEEKDKEEKDKDKEEKDKKEKEKDKDKEEKDKKEKEKDKEEEIKEEKKEEEIKEKKINEKEENKDDKDNKIYLLRLKLEYQKEIENIKEELNKGELNQKDKEDDFKPKKSKTNKSKINNNTEKISSNKSSKNKKQSFEEKIKTIEKLYSDKNKTLFYTLLRHIWKTSSIISEDIFKGKKYEKYSRNYLFDLDTSLSVLNCILHIYPCYLSLLLQFTCGKRHKMNFIKYLIKHIFPLLNYYHNCVSWPGYLNNIEDLENITMKEKQDVIKCYNTRANSFQSFFESFRNINLISSLIYSITYKRRNMNENEILLINETRKKILNEINLILQDISQQKNNDFNFLNKNDELFPKNVINYKTCIIILYSMAEFMEGSDIYNQLNPLEISNLVYSKEFSIVKNITHILKNMKIDEKNEIFHEMGIKYLSQLFKFIKINPKKSDKEKKEDNKNTNKNKNNNYKDNKDKKESNKNDKNDKNGMIEENNENEIKDEIENIEENNNDIHSDNLSNINDNSSQREDNNMDIDDSNSINNPTSSINEDMIMEQIMGEDSSEEEDSEGGSNSNSDSGESNEEEEEEEEEGEEEEEDFDDEDDINPENILEDNNAQEDLFSLMPSDEDDSAENESNQENNINLNNLNLRIIQNRENLNENEEENNDMSGQINLNNLEIIIGDVNHNNNQEENQASERNEGIMNYNEENLLYYNPYSDSIPNLNKSQIKTEINSFYEEFIVFPFLVTSTKSKNNLIYFFRPKIDIDILNNTEKEMVNKTLNVFIYYYLFQSELNFNRYFNFVLIGLKNKTSLAYFNELDKIVNDFLSIYSVNSLDKIEITRKDVIKLIKDDESVIKEKDEEKIEKEINDEQNKEKEKDNELLEEIPEEFRDLVGKKLQKEKGKEKEKEKDKEDKDKEKDKQNEKQEKKDKKNKKVSNEKSKSKNKPKDEKDEKEENKEKEQKEEKVEKDEPKLNNDNKEKKNNENIDNNLEDNNNNGNNVNHFENNDFLLDLPPELREEILSDLDPALIPTLSPELLREYNRIINRNNDLILYPIYDNLEDNNIYSAQDQDSNDNFLFYNGKKKVEYQLRKLKYKREELISNFSNTNNTDENNIINIFDDDFLETLIVYNIKTILIFQNKDTNKFNEYDDLLIQLMSNENLRYKILDILLNLWICDTSCLYNLLKTKKIPPKNSFLKNLYYLYIQTGLTEDYFFGDYEHFFISFATKHTKDMKKFFLKTIYNEKNGGYILLNNNKEKDKEKDKEFSITENSKNLKKLLNIKYKNGENVLNNLISMTLLNNKSNLKTIFSIKIFTSVIQNCLKNIISEDNINNTNNNEDKNKNNELNINVETIEKILDLFNNFEAALYLSKGQRSNNPTSLLIEMINDQNIFSILLDVLLKRIKAIKENITKEMDDFFKNKKFDIQLFNKLLPDIVLFKLVKFISSVNENFNEQITDLENKTKSKNKNDKKDNDKNNNNNNDKNNNKNLQTKKEMLNKLKQFIKNINNILFSCWEQLNNLLLDINSILKDNQDFIVPKLNRLIPYLETFITLSHLQFISTNSNTNNNEKAFIFEKNFVSNLESPSPGPSPNPLTTKNEIDVFVEFFYEFCEKNKKIINFILRQYPKMFTNELILKISSLLDLENKQKYFRHCLKKLPSSKKFIDICVRRNGPELFTDSFNQLSVRDGRDLRGKLIVNFDEEEAIDAGGVKREWLTLLSKEMFSPNYMLFTLAKNGTTYTINSDSGKYNNEMHLKYFEFIGKIMAKAIFDGMMIDCYFTRTIYKLILGTPISYHDMEDYDPVYFNSIKWLLENDFSNSDTYLSYSYNHDNLGEIQTVDLVENGRNIDVNEENKFDYIQRLCSYKLYDTIKPQIDSLLKGFYEIIPQKLISIFNHRELELVISGMPTIDIKDWKNNTIYENYTEESDVVKFFWEIIESFDNDERAEFLQFVTGSSKVPLEGFSALQGIGGINKFKISKVFDKNYDRLPTAHTCTNQLDLPEYPNKEILYERLRLAIKEGKNSFGFA